MTGQTRYGNVLVAPGASDVLLATVGSFQFWGHCDGFGNAQTLKSTTTNANSIEDEDNSNFGNFNVGDTITGDEDYDETGFARDNTTGLTLITQTS